VVKKVSNWYDFTRHARRTRNALPAHSAVAVERGTLGLCRFYSRVRADTGQIFNLYYDRAIKDVDNRLGRWFLYREMKTGD
jgi:hypothetical protein